MEKNIVAMRDPIVGIDGRKHYVICGERNEMGRWLVKFGHVWVRKTNVMSITECAACPAGVYDADAGLLVNSPADIAVENVEALIRGEITEPSEGTLAARVLEWAKSLGNPVVTATVNGVKV